MIINTKSGLHLFAYEEVINKFVTYENLDINSGAGDIQAVEVPVMLFYMCVYMPTYTHTHINIIYKYIYIYRSRSCLRFYSTKERTFYRE
jgi:hypothetical protein